MCGLLQIEQSRSGDAKAESGSGESPGARNTSNSQLFFRGVESRSTYNACPSPALPSSSFIPLRQSTSTGSSFFFLLDTRSRLYSTTQVARSCSLAPRTRLRPLKPPGRPIHTTHIHNGAQLTERQQALHMEHCILPFHGHRRWLDARDACPRCGPGAHR